jgi:hypothetical protein
MKKNTFSALILALVFSNCQLKTTTPVEATVRLVNTRGVPIVGHEMRLTKQFPNNVEPKITDEIIEKKLTDSKGEVIFSYQYQVHESAAENWFVVPKETSTILPYNYYRYNIGSEKQNYTIILDTIVPIRVRYKNSTPNTMNILTDASINGTEAAPQNFFRFFDSHTFKLAGMKDTTVTFNAFARSTFRIGTTVNGFGSDGIVYNGGLVRDSVFLITL